MPQYISINDRRQFPKVYDYVYLNDEKLSHDKLKDGYSFWVVDNEEIYETRLLYRNEI